MSKKLRGFEIQGEGDYAFARRYDKAEAGRVARAARAWAPEDVEVAQAQKRADKEARSRSKGAFLVR